MSVSGKRIPYLLTIVLVFAAIIITALPPKSVLAAQITARSLTLQATSGNYNGSAPSAVVDHLFSFTLPTAGTISSIQFLYCTTADGTCTTPSGLTTTSATLGTQTGLTFSSVVNTTNGAPYLTSSSGVTVTANEAVSFQLDTITNPNGTSCTGTLNNCTFFVRISTYTTTTATGTPVDTGVVAAATTQQITLTGTMPESLIFCVGGTVSETSGTPDCTTVTSGSVTFNQDFSPTATATATSQMAASTNANHGYVITVWGTTLTSGSNTITAMTTAGTSAIGTAQFGMNLEVNTTPAVGTALTPASDGVNYFGYPETGYNTANTFEFNSGNTVANSGYSTGTPTVATDAQIYTTSYIVNVPGKQAPGTYTTTLTYICTPTF